MAIHDPRGNEGGSILGSIGKTIRRFISRVTERS
jgi:hypothetical protein